MVFATGEACFFAARSYEPAPQRGKSALAGPTCTRPLTLGDACTPLNADFSSGGCEDGSMLIAEETGSPGDDGDAACEIEEVGDAVVCSGHAEISLQGVRRAVINVHCICGLCGSL